MGQGWIDCTSGLGYSLSLLLVSEAPKVAPVAKKFPSYNPHFKTDEEKKEEVTGYSMFLLPVFV